MRPSSFLALVVLSTQVNAITFDEAIDQRLIKMTRVLHAVTRDIQRITLAK